MIDRSNKVLGKEDVDEPDKEPCLVKYARHPCTVEGRRVYERTGMIVRD